MTPKEALSVLDQASSSAHMTRLDHMRSQEALQVLDRLIDNISNMIADTPEPTPIHPVEPPDA